MSASTKAKPESRMSGEELAELAALLGVGAGGGALVGAPSSASVILPSMAINAVQGEPVLEQSNPAFVHALQTAALLGTLGAGTGYGVQRARGRQHREALMDGLWTGGYSAGGAGAAVGLAELINSLGKYAPLEGSGELGNSGLVIPQ